MIKTPIFASGNEAATAQPSGMSELVRTLEALRSEAEVLRRERSQLAEQLAEVQVSSQTDRQARRAALNLMEDAVQARAAEQRENAERRRVEEELRSADRRKDEFLATLAHELRNPLAPIRNSVELLRMTGADKAAVDQVSEMLDRQVNHMVRLVDDLMEMSRITRSQIELQRERVELSAVIRSAIEISTPLIQAARHRLKVEIPEEAVFLDGDPVRLAQVFSNLLNNAAKYTAEGGSISLAAGRENTDVVVRIRDNGTGIPTVMLPRIFDLFVQCNRGQNKSPGGLGIGLTLVQRLVELHGGRVSAKSDGIGHGSEFTVRLPISSSDPRQRKTRQAGSSESTRVAFRRILVVDDNRDSANSLATVLKCLGCDVSVAHDGESALRTFETYRPSIVLLDIGMPEMDGHEAARRIRQSSLGHKVVLIALTGWGQEEDRRRSKDAGFDFHLVKPVELHALQGLLNSVPETEPAPEILNGLAPAG